MGDGVDGAAQPKEVMGLLLLVFGCRCEGRRRTAPRLLAMLLLLPPLGEDLETAKKKAVGAAAVFGLGKKGTAAGL